MKKGFWSLFLFSAAILLATLGCVGKNSALLLFPIQVSGQDDYGWCRGRPYVSNNALNEAGLPFTMEGERDTKSPPRVEDLMVKSDTSIFNAYTKNGKFTAEFLEAYCGVREKLRLAELQREVDWTRGVPMTFNASEMNNNDKMFLKVMAQVGVEIDALHLKVHGGDYDRDKPKGDLERGVYYRNFGPWCSGPDAGEFCNASRAFPKQHSLLYPPDLEESEATCAMLRAQSNQAELLDHFNVVVRDGRGGFKAVPYPEAFLPEMKKIGQLLFDAAKWQLNDPAMYRYLREAAQAFRDNNWFRADEAWVKMVDGPGKFYVRVGPDEVYDDPCGAKASFHLSLGLKDRSLAGFREMFKKYRQAIENRIAKLTGPAYKARVVNYVPPVPIKIIINAGSARVSAGAIIGEALPNWGLVAKEGRGAMMIATNFYIDRQSLENKQKRAEALLANLDFFTLDPTPGNLVIFFHEAGGHNSGAGPTHEINGKNPEAIFGGHLASTMEELKAETLAALQMQMLRQAGIISEQTLRQAYTSIIEWCLNHLARGLWQPDGITPRHYSQVGAIILGTALQDGAVSFAGGKFKVHYPEIEDSIIGLAIQTNRIKAAGDKVEAEAMIRDFVKCPETKLHLDVIKRAIGQYKKERFMPYTIVYDKPKGF